MDGIFGSKTLQSVRAYQESHGISHARGNFFGVAGPRTLGSLGYEHTRTSVANLQTATAPYIPTAKLTAPAPSSAPGNLATSVINDAKRYIGTPYKWGGTSITGFDCSGLIQKVFKDNGLSLPRTTAQMWDATDAVSSPMPGDLVFFETRQGPSHVGIYMGNDQFIHSGSSTGVTITSMDNSYWSSRYLGARRLGADAL
ncbi:C40 family peptidase [Paenalkalicoccus suaedae]|uniref:C40 family peptidase n=1 Tax=Paenalkalicoccus suaedae TaxID=2592382 RepID=A0A859FK06_9BACI|nr:C40 family peptidase [Paenalkalicoccus suaedae]